MSSFRARLKVQHEAPDPQHHSLADFAGRHLRLLPRARLVPNHHGIRFRLGVDPDDCVHRFRQPERIGRFHPGTERGARQPPVVRPCFNTPNRVRERSV